MSSIRQPTIPNLRPLTAPVNLSQEVANRLREAILSGSLTPGTRLIERDIAEQLGISRMPVREAIQQLVDDGLLVKEPRRGAYVHPYSDTEIEEISSLRAAMERFVIERVIERWSESAARQLQTIVDSMYEAARAGEIYRMYELDDMYHRTLWSLAEHQLLLEIVAGLRARISRFLLEATHALPPDRLEEHVATHEQLLNTIKRRELAAAQADITQHIMVARDRIREHYRYLSQTSARH